jgi:hypothetical protein
MALPMGGAGMALLVGIDFEADTEGFKAAWGFTSGLPASLAAGWGCCKLLVPGKAEAALTGAFNPAA